MEELRVIFFDVFGTVVDWYTGVSQQIKNIAQEHAVEIDADAITIAWRAKYSSSISQVNQGLKEWACVDDLQSESLDELLKELN